MIPSDLAARLRTLTEASFFDSEPPVQGTAKVREIQARLPQLLPGQPFTATLTRPLPDGTFQAIIAGRTYTLALAHTAKAGDTLELVVTKHTPNALHAQLAQPDAAQQPAGAAARAELSATGRLISFLLTGQPAPRPVALAGGAPLLNAPPAGRGATLAPALSQALSQSGLFYEAHQQKWVAGKLDTAALLREPQGRYAPATAHGASAQAATTFAFTSAASAGTGMPAPGTTSAGTPPPGQPAPGQPAPGQPASGQSAAAAPLGATSTTARPQHTPVQPGAGQSATADAASAPPQGRVEHAVEETPAARAPSVPERLIPVVHQQLDAMATQHYVVHAQAWPGQSFEWELDDPEQRQHGGDDDKDQTWRTTLRLSMPRLGGVEAQLHLTPAGLAVRVHATDSHTAAELAAARDLLEAALEAADIPLTGFVAERGNVE